MTIQSLIAVVMGLALQLALVPARGSSRSAPCSGGESSMSCCAGHTCPCAKIAPATPKPAPALPLEGDTLKFVAHSASTQEALPETPSRSVEVPAVQLRGPPRAAGFQGVSLAVAFCRFVI